MKKVIIALMAGVMLFALCGCISTNEGEVDPDKVKQSITGIDEDEFFVPMGLDSIDILDDGEAILHANGKLLDRVGNNYVAAMGVEEAYVLPIGNGGYRIVLFRMHDGTVAGLSSRKMIENASSQLKTNLGKLENIVDITTEEGLIYAVDKSGKKIMLDEYLDF